MSTPSGYNPYQPPKADLTPPPVQQDGEFIQGGQSVPFANVFGWIGAAWGLFKQSPGIWILMLIIMFVLSIVMGIIPVLGALANYLLTPVFVGGVLLGCKALDDGESLEVSHLFAGFKEKAGPLFLLGLIQLACIIVLGIILVIGMVIVFGSGLFQTLSNPSAASSFIASQGVTIIFGFLLAILLIGIPFAMSFWFAPVLVVMQNLSPMNALAQSFKGSSRNFFQLILCAIVFVVLFILGCIPILLGLLIVVPMLYCSIYTAYKDIYLQK